MKPNELIKKADGRVLPEVLSEMEYLEANPEQFHARELTPNFEQMTEDIAIPMYHFYIGMAFGNVMTEHADL